MLKKQLREMGQFHRTVSAVFWPAAAAIAFIAAQSEKTVLAETPAGDKIVHQQSFHFDLPDPAFPDKPTRRVTVVQAQDANGFPLEYSTHIVTEVCTDKKCKLVEVTMYWNALGFFKRIECDPDKPLTKKEHTPFTPEDYEKLERILGDPNSILGQQSLAFLAKPPDDLNPDIDGWSGATPVTVQQSVVKDAAYTTWVMWLWANGDIVPRLREITMRSCTPAFLSHLLKSDDSRDVDFALKYIRQHHAADSQFAEPVFHVLETGGRDQIAQSLAYLDKAVKDRAKLHARLIDACLRMKATYSPMILAYFSSQRELPETTLEKLSCVLDRLPYFQVHLILRLLDQRNYFSDQVEADAARLLDHNDFFIARRAFEYLVEHDLSGETQRKVDAFRERYHDRL